MAEAKNNQTPDVSEQDKIRRGKLADLQAAGNDPFLITKYNVTHHSMEIKNNFDELEGQEVTVAGRMMQKRVIMMKDGKLIHDESKGGYLYERY
mgnify:CR=1 FL=1